MRVSASRIAPAEVMLPRRQSACGNNSSSLGAALFARGPRFPRAPATQRRMESSEVSSKETISDRVASSRLPGATRRASSARCSAAFVLMVAVSPFLTFAIVSANCFLSMGLSFAHATLPETEIKADAITIKRNIDPYFNMRAHSSLYLGGVQVLTTGAVALVVGSFGSVVVDGRAPA